MTVTMTITMMMSMMIMMMIIVMIVVVTMIMMMAVRHITVILVLGCTETASRRETAPKQHRDTLTTIC